MMNKLMVVGSILCLALTANAQTPSNPNPEVRKPERNQANDAYKKAQMQNKPLPEKPKKPSKPSKPQGKTN